MSLLLEVISFVATMSQCEVPINLSFNKKMSFVTLPFCYSVLFSQVCVTSNLLNEMKFIYFEFTEYFDDVK